jgi:hypothetical protein
LPSSLCSLCGRSSRLGPRPGTNRSTTARRRQQRVLLEHRVGPMSCWRPTTDEGIGFSVGCPLIIPMIIQTILLDPTGAVWTDKASNVSSPDPSGADQADAEHPSRKRKVEVRARPGDGRTAVLGHATISAGAGAGVEAVGPALTSRRREDRVSSGHGRNRSEGRRPRPGPRAPEGGLFRRGVGR